MFLFSGSGRRPPPVHNLRSKHLSDPPARDHRRPFALEPLESRELFSVTVSQGYPGYYDIVGDSADDQVYVSVSMTNRTFTLDGTTYSDVAYISVDGGPGGDAISVLSLDGSGVIGAGVSGGPGSDSLSLNFGGAIWGGTGMDEVSLSDSFYGQAYGEEGDDHIIILGACVSADIDGGNGGDLIDCTRAACPVVVHGGAGSDTIYGSPYDDQIYGDSGPDMLYGGRGNDTIYARNGSPDDIGGGGGWDIVFADPDGEHTIIDVEQIIYG